MHKVLILLADDYPGEVNDSAGYPELAYGLWGTTP